MWCTFDKFTFVFREGFEERFEDDGVGVVVSVEGPDGGAAIFFGADCLGEGVTELNGLDGREGGEGRGTVGSWLRYLVNSRLHHVHAIRIVCGE